MGTEKSGSQRSGPKGNVSIALTRPKRRASPKKHSRQRRRHPNSLKTPRFEEVAIYREKNVLRAPEFGLAGTGGTQRGRDAPRTKNERRENRHCKDVSRVHKLCVRKLLRDSSTDWGKGLLCTGETMLHEAWFGRAPSFATPVLLFLYISPRGEPDVSDESGRHRFPVNVEVHSKRRDDSKQRGKQQKTALLTIVPGKNARPRQFQR